MPPKLSESEYAGLLELVSTEIENAFLIYQTYEELNRLALGDVTIFRVLNADASFWQPYRGILLSSLFITMSRIFDPASDAITVQKLVTATLANVQLFSKEALKARKIGGGPEPAWIDDYMKNVWVPIEATQLRFLQKALNPHISLFTSVYLPIRNNIYAHRLMSDDRAGAELFPKTNREEIGETINFLRELVAVIQNLYRNGDEPKLGGRNLSDRGKRIRTGVEMVLRKLANASPLIFPQTQI